MSRAATHNGTCQVCGRLQAVTSNGIAKHGYNVKHGWFSGVCQGSGFGPLELSKEKNEAVVAWLRKQSATLAATTPAVVEARGVTVTWTDYRKAYTLRGCWKLAKNEDEFNEIVAALPGYQRGHWTTWARAVERTVYADHSRGLAMLDNAKDLVMLREARFCKPLLPRAGAKTAGASCASWFTTRWADARRGTGGAS